jgi:hypothetical protein
MQIDMITFRQRLVGHTLETKLVEVCILYNNGRRLKKQFPS